MEAVLSRSKVLQATVKGKLEADFNTFQQRTGLNDSDAVRDLLTLALRIKLNDVEDDRPSNRELMEEMYRRIRQIQVTDNLTHSQSFDGEMFFKNKTEAAEMRKVHVANVNNKVDEYLEGVNKES